MIKNEKNRRHITQNNRGFTLIELLIAGVIFLLVFTGILATYIACLELAEISKNSSIATQTCKGRLETIKDTDFIQIQATYHQVGFTTPNFNGRGVSYVDILNGNVTRVTLVFCWKQPNGRVIGEDKNLNGQLDGGEDSNGNNRIDSLVNLVTDIYHE